MSFPRYPKYKDSGVEWLGEVPEHWQLKPLYGSAVERYETNKGMVEDNLLSLSYGKIVQKDISSNDGLLPESFETYQVVHPGDIVFRLTDLQNDKRSLRSALVQEKGIITSAYLAVTPRRLDSSFTSYLFRAYDVTKVFYSMGGGLRQSMKFADVKRMPTLIPPLDEQTTIAKFLDQETAKIDELVVEQQRLMELLKEKRQAVISHAITKGLNPNAPMKPSGIEWLGDVPAHWSVVPLKRILDAKDGTHATPLYVDPTDDTYPLITSKDFGEKTIYFDDAKHISIEDHFEIVKRSNTEQGDVLMSMIGGNIGKALTVDTDRKFSIKNVALFKTKKSEDLARFLLNYLQSGLLKVQIDLISRGGAQGFLGLGDIRNLVFFKMPAFEMQQIVEHLDTELSKLDTLTTEAQRAIDLLQERRTALISAAVTGQIDVRQATN